MNKKYDSTIARIAGNIASGFVGRYSVYNSNDLAIICVEMARLIVEEVSRTEPKVNNE